MTHPLAATRPVRFALRTVLVAHTKLTAIVAQRVYNGAAPQGAAMPYIIIRNPTQRTEGTFGDPGASGEWYLDAWSATADEAERILGEIVTALDGTVVTSADLAHLTGQVEVLDVRRDPDSSDTSVYHGIAVYRWTAFGEAT